MNNEERSKLGDVLNYLRTERRRIGFTQAEVAYLFGQRCGSKISRYERGTRQPSLETTLGLEIAYRTPLRELFGDLYQKVERAMAKRARFLLRRLSRPNMLQRNPRKLAVLAALVRRPSIAPNRLPGDEAPQNSRD